MEAESLFERLRKCVSGECLGVECRDAPFSAKRVASLGDMVSGTMSDLPAGEGRKPDLALLNVGLDALKPDLACNMAPSQSQSHACYACANKVAQSVSAFSDADVCIRQQANVIDACKLLVACCKPCASAEVAAQHISHGAYSW